ncbi:MAG: DUF1552 domain-containing protein [Lentisphaeraceae bacterium]|nr:DUF1552 domain-containing protein [Lentisphaeraceae bacterium]
MRNFHNLLRTTTNRRTFLKGSSATLLLPQMASIAGDKAVINPTRMTFLHVPNGMIMDKYKPKSYGENYEMAQTLKPLESLRKDFQVISGLHNKNGESNGDGGGDHARAQGNFLTAVRILKSTKRVSNGISVDQVAAQAAGHQTYLPSLELSSRKGRLSGACDSGYSCMYQFNLSWKNAKEPLVPESNAQLAFNRLFTLADSNKARAQQKMIAATEKSMLDFMQESAKSLKKNIGKEDSEKLDQYFTNLREMERKAQRQKPKVKMSQMTRDFTNQPQSYPEKIEALMDLMVLAWEVDATRICSMIVADGGSNQSFPELGINGGHHTLSHHRGKKDIVAQLEKIDLFYMNRLAYFLKKLNDRKVNGQSLLQQSMVMYGSGISNGNSHSHKNLSMVLAGHANGKLTPGTHREYKKAPLANLYVSMLEKFGTPVKSFADSTGKLERI